MLVSVQTLLNNREDREELGVRGLVTVLLVTFVDICTKTIDKSMDNKTVTSSRTPKFIANHKSGYAFL